MTNLQMWSLIAGFFLPPIQAFVQQSHWSSVLRAIVNFVSCLLVAAGVAYFNGSLTGKSWVQAALVVVVATIATYHGLWKPTTIAPIIETATTPKTVRRRTTAHR
jgi:uncharacterized membrane protein YqaE (UPF0057 family)